MDIEKVTFDEKSFRWAHAADPCGNYKLSEGIVKFAEDTEKLEEYIAKRIAASK